MTSTTECSPHYTECSPHTTTKCSPNTESRTFSVSPSLSGEDSELASMQTTEKTSFSSSPSNTNVEKSNFSSLSNTSVEKTSLSSLSNTSVERATREVSRNNSSSKKQGDIKVDFMRNQIASTNPKLLQISFYHQLQISSIFDFKSHFLRYLT